MRLVREHSSLVELHLRGYKITEENAIEVIQKIRLIEEIQLQRYLTGIFRSVRCLFGYWFTGISRSSLNDFIVTVKR